MSFTVLCVCVLLSLDTNRESAKNSCKCNRSGSSSAGHYRNLRCVKCFLCSSLWQLTLAIREGSGLQWAHYPPPLPSLCVFIRDCCAELFDGFVFPAVNHTIRDVTNTILACSWIHSDSWIFVSLTETQRGMHFTRAPPSLKPEIDLISLLFSFQYCGKKKKYETQPWHFAKVQNANRLFFPAYSAPEINPLRHSIWQTHLGWRVGAGKGEV